MANIQTSARMGSCPRPGFSLKPDTRNTQWFWKLIGYGSCIEKYFGFGSGIGYPLVPAHQWYPPPQSREELLLPLSTAMFFREVQKSATSHQEGGLHIEGRGWISLCLLNQGFICAKVPKIAHCTLQFWMFRLMKPTSFSYKLIRWRPCAGGSILV